ncbi:hypothetical protein [Skermanella pratensis]|uniref:hypothetical protein n=1 Tax=Skermanella pratensis TaxID=2233999 RepID=UPI0013015245|nr:hypothetical protein [Skermanella pratensis]
MNETLPPFTTRLSGDHVPATFEERGATVPFQKPDLANARVRRGAQGELEALVYGFSGGRGVYILPWRALPDILRLNLHDLTLHAEVLTTLAVTPERIQVAAYRVARSGLAGEAMLQDADDLLADRAQVATVTAFHLLRRLIPSPGLTVNGYPMTPLLLATAAGKVAARAALQPENLFDRIQKAASLALPLGVDAEGGRGPLRTLFARVRDFAARIEGAGGDATVLIADVARLTVAIGEDLIRHVDAMTADPGPLLEDWDSRGPAFRQAVDRLAWLLDGWQPVCDLWSNWPGSTADPALALTTLRILPLVPKDECGRFHADAASLYRRQSTVFNALQEEG